MNINKLRLRLSRKLLSILLPSDYVFNIFQPMSKKEVASKILSEISIGLKMIDLLELSDNNKDQILAQSMDPNFDKNQCADMLQEVFLETFAEVKPIAADIQQQLFTYTPHLSHLDYDDYLDVLFEINSGLDAFYDKAKDHIWNIIYIEIEKVSKSTEPTTTFYTGVVGDA